MELLDQRRDIAVVDRGTLCDLQRYIFWIQLKRIQNITVFIHNIAEVQADSGDIHGNGIKLHSGLLPFLLLCADGAEYIFIQSGNIAVFLKQRNKLCGRKHRSVGALPTDQSLGTQDVSSHGIDLGLIPQLEFSVFQCIFERIFNQPVLRQLLDIQLIIEGIMSCALIFYQIFCLNGFSVILLHFLVICSFIDTAQREHTRNIQLRGQIGQILTHTAQSGL